MKIHQFAATFVLLAAIATASAQPTSSDPSFDWEATGVSVYQNNCASCHGADGAGIPSAFPPLAGHVPELVVPEGGRILLTDILLYGLSGPIEVAGVAFNGAMPAWGQLSDEQIAAVMNHISTAWSNAEALPADFVLYGPADVAAEREKGLTAADVHVLRSQVLSLETAATPTDASSGAAYSDDTGYFTAAQAEAGRAVYENACASCHGSNLRGGIHAPALAQRGFFREWGGRTLDTLSAYIYATMPPNAPQSLSNSDLTLVLAHWLSMNGYPSGEVPLDTDPAALRSITLERR